MSARAPGSAGSLADGHRPSPQSPPGSLLPFERFAEAQERTSKQADDLVVRKAEQRTDLAVGQAFGSAEAKDLALVRPKCRRSAPDCSGINSHALAVHRTPQIELEWVRHRLGVAGKPGGNPFRPICPRRTAGRRRLRRMVGTARIFPLDSPCGHF
jgi:hypothetical protein